MNYSTIRSTLLLIAVAVVFGCRTYPRNATRRAFRKMRSGKPSEMNQRQKTTNGGSKNTVWRETGRREEIKSK